MSRPRNIKSVAIKIIGVAGVSALAKADIYLVEGKTIRELTTACELDEPKALVDLLIDEKLQSIHRTQPQPPLPVLPQLPVYTPA